MGLIARAANTLKRDDCLRIEKTTRKDIPEEFHFYQREEYVNC